MQIVRSRRFPKYVLWAARVALLSFFFVILFNWWQPFSKRYLGRTTKDWIDEWTVTGSLVRSDVVDAFGGEVLPELISNLPRSKGLTGVLERNFPSLATRYYSITRADQRFQKVIDWICILHHRKTPVLLMLLHSGHTNVIDQVLKYHTYEELERIITDEQNPIIKDRARLSQWGGRMIVNQPPGDILIDRITAPAPWEKGTNFVSPSGGLRATGSKTERANSSATGNAKAESD